MESDESDEKDQTTLNGYEGEITYAAGKCEIRWQDGDSRESLAWVEELTDNNVKLEMSRFKPPPKFKQGATTLRYELPSKIKV